MKLRYCLCAVVLFALLPSFAFAQAGVTTANVQGAVKDAQGAVVPGALVVARHEPSGTTYEDVTRADGRFFLSGLRVGGPYTISAALAGFTTEALKDVMLALGVTADAAFTLKVAAVNETVTVVGKTDPVFSSGRTGAATAVLREQLESLPSVSGRLTDITRLTPQYGASGSIAGQDNRANNVTVDGSYFNNSFGLGVSTGQIGDRTGVAPVSLEVIEQVQVNVAPFDVRQGSFTGAGVNTVTRSGTNSFTGSVYRRQRNESEVGTNAAGLPFNPGTFDTTVTGFWAGGPIVQNRLFVFGSFEKQSDVRPLSTFTCNPGGAPVSGSMTRVLCSDMATLQAYLKQNLSYDTGVYTDIPKNTPAKPWMAKGDFNINGSNKVTFRYNQLDSSSNIYQSGSSSLGAWSRATNTTQFLGFANSNYQIVENLKSTVGEWNSVFGGSFINNLLVGYIKQDESRGPQGQQPLFPTVVIGAGDGSAYTMFGNEPFTPYNLLRHTTFQAQDSVTKAYKNHSFTFGGNIEKFHSDNSFYFGIQSAYSYNTLADFYADANGYVANPNRTAAAVPNRFQVKYLLQPGQTTPPLQSLDVLYGGAYFQDAWRPANNVTITGGVRVDIPKFGNTAFNNPVANTLTFNDNGTPTQYNTGALPATTPYWSPRVGFNWDVAGDQRMQIRGGTGVFSGKPPYVWISNQIGNTGVLYGFLDSGSFVSAYPFNPNPDKYKPVATGGTAASYEIDVTDKSFRFPQTWRSNIGVDRKLFWGMVGTLDFMYGRDLNEPLYVQANLPQPDSAYTGIDTRPRWVAIPGVAPACVTTIGSENGPCVIRVNNSPGKNITAAYVIKSQNQNYSWNMSGAVTKSLDHGLSFKTGFNYGVARSLVEPSSTAGSGWGSGNPIPANPNNPPLGYSFNSPGKRIFAAVNYSAHYFGWGATTVSIFYDGRTNGNTSYVFSGDANGDTVSGNDLLYIPSSTSEMNFKTLTVSGTTYSPADQAAAFEQYIQ
ncbi:MAG: carboxypeptidase regulatory-like domain-containing protein, partial [Acidobacteriota bacterium]